MTNYNVHLYREMRLVFDGIEAETPETAAAIARDMQTRDAVEIDDCEGMTLSALVDVDGDADYEHSVIIDFEEERQRKAGPALLAACRMVVARWEHGDLAEAARACSDAIVAAEAAGMGSDFALAKRPSRFEIEHDPAENSDRVYVMVDGKFDVAVIRTDEGVVVDVYPKDGFETIATTYAFDSDAEQESSTN